jgi:hemerythrin
MERITWNSTFSVGITKIDEQHRRLIDMINLLIDNPDADVHSEPVSEVLVRMTEYALLHFQTEEELMRQYHYPDLNTHEQEHTAFKLKASGFFIQTMDGKKSVPTEILEFLKQWLTHHILNSDMKYSVYIREHGKQWPVIP